MVSFGHPRVAVALGTTEEHRRFPSKEMSRPDSTDNTWDGLGQGKELCLEVV